MKARSLLLLVVAALFSSFLSLWGHGSVDKDGEMERQRETQLGIVIVSGPNGDGTGFLANINETVVVITNIHLLKSLGPDGCIRLTSVSGRDLVPVSFFGVKGRDILLIRIEDEEHHRGKSLSIAGEVHKSVCNGDRIQIAGNSKGLGSLVWSEGRVVALGAKVIEHDVPTLKGNSGSPIMHVDSGKVIGVDTYEVKVDIGDVFSKDPFSPPDSALRTKIRRFGYRIDSNLEWYSIDPMRFYAQYMMLEELKFERDQIIAFMTGQKQGWEDHGGLSSAVRRLERDISEVSSRRVRYIGSDEFTDFFKVYYTIHPQERSRIDRSFGGLLRNIIFNNTYARLKDGRTVVYDYFEHEAKFELNLREYLVENIEKWKDAKRF